MNASASVDALLHVAVETVFRDTFTESQYVCMVGGADEPLYAPAGDGSGISVIRYREDFASSALHEAAHWCIASRRRRQLVDYGYWYEGERDRSAQQRFEDAEVRPQALEGIFTVAGGLDFRESADNIAFPETDTTVFRARIARAARDMLSAGLSKRAARFADALAQRFGGDWRRAAQYR